MGGRRQRTGVAPADSRTRRVEPELGYQSLRVARRSDPAHLRPGPDQSRGPYTAADRSPRGTLWTAIIERDEIEVELFVPSGAARAVLEITRVNRGYRSFG